MVTARAGWTAPASLQPLLRALYSSEALLQQHNPLAVPHVRPVEATALPVPGGNVPQRCTSAPPLPLA